MKFLARDVSTFSTMINEKYIYVDKTQHIYNLYTTKDRYHFLARPRRFGKTLLISTLKELFGGNKELFQGLWIAKSDWPFKKHIVLHLDFSTIAHRTTSDLETSIHDRLDEMAKLHGFDVNQKQTFEDKINILIPKLAEVNPLVLLVDEYDHPLLKHIGDQEIASANQKVLKSFYEAIKGQDAYFRAIFITGVSKFSKTSIFSGLNNLQDISEKPAFAHILGYTLEEIEYNFKEAVEAFAAARQVECRFIMNEMHFWYNGYRFSAQDIKVYNPFSVLNYLKDQKLANYWFSSGTPTFLIEVLKSDPSALFDLENSIVDANTFNAYEIGDIPTLTLLYQTGYLTIKKYENLFDTDTFTLGYPNEEVKRSIAVLMLAVLTDQKKEHIDSALFRLRMTLYRNDIDTFCQILQTLLARIPYQLHIPREAYYHSLLQFLADLLGFDSASEVSTGNGRIDLVITIKNRIYIFEFKLNQASQTALNQMLLNRYSEMYKGKGKKIMLIGLSFTIKDKKLTIDRKIEHEEQFSVEPTLNENRLN